MWEFVAKKVCKLGSKTWIWILIWPAVKRHVQKWPFESQNGFSYLTKTFWTMQWKAIQVYSEGFLSTLVALEPIYISLFVRQKSFVSKGISEENKINIYNVPTLYSFNGLIKHQLEWLNQTTIWSNFSFKSMPQTSFNLILTKLQSFKINWFILAASRVHQFWTSLFNCNVRTWVR